MEFLKQYPSQYSEPFRVTFGLLNVCCIGIMDDSCWTWKRKCRAAVTLMSYLFFFSYVTFYVRLTIIFGEENRNEILCAIVPAIMVCLEAVIKGTIVLMNKNKLKHIIHRLGENWRTDQLTEVQMEIKNKLLNKHTAIQKFFSYGSLVGPTLNMWRPLLETILRKNVMNQNCKLLLPIPGFVLDTHTNWGLYMIVYLFQISNMYLLIFTYLAPEFLLFTFVSHIVTELKLLKEDIAQIKNEKRGNLNEDGNVNLKMFFGEFVRKHQMLTELILLLDDVYNKMIFVILLFLTVIICFFAFSAEIVSDTSTKIINTLGTSNFLLNALYLAYYGELIMEASSGITEAIYETPWYKYDKSIQKSVAILIMRSQKECCLTSLKYAPLTLNTFTTVLSTSWSYFSLTRGLYQ